MFKFHRGDYLLDVVTGFKGVVTGRADYLTGCNTYFLQGRLNEKGELPERWIDEARLEFDHEHLGKKLMLDIT